MLARSGSCGMGGLPVSNPPTSERLVFRSASHALSHPVLVGHVAGWRLPWAVSVTQLAAVTTTAAVLLTTRSLWAHLGPVGNVVVFTLVVVGVGWLVRHWRVEGRAPLSVAVTVAGAVCSPGVWWGRRSGRPVYPTRPVYSSTTGIVVIGGGS